LIVQQVAEKLPRIALGIQSFAVHVPQNANWFLSFSFTLKDGRFTSAGSLILELDLKLRRGYETNTILVALKLEFEKNHRSNFTLNTNEDDGR
jgi:hypothetical protein